MTDDGRAAGSIADLVVLVDTTQYTVRPPFSQCYLEFNVCWLMHRRRVNSGPERERVRGREEGDRWDDGMSIRGTAGAL